MFYLYMFVFYEGIIMDYNIFELCDLFVDNVDVVELMFISYGGCYLFGGEVIIVKCFEDCELIDCILSELGDGKVLLIDGGGLLCCVLIDIEFVQFVVENNWEGIVCYGCVCEVDNLVDFDIGIFVINVILVNVDCQGIGEVDILVNFGGVIFLLEDYLYVDSIGVILLFELLDID